MKGNLEVSRYVANDRMTPELKDAFLCHNRADKNWVRKLGQHLEEQTIDGLPSSRQLTVFFDEWDIDYGENVLTRINQGLAAARNVVVVMSPEFFASGWTNLEWTDVVAEDPWGTNKKLIPILLRDVTLDGTRRIALPAPFKALRYFDFRPSKSFEEEFIKLLRRIRGLPPVRGTFSSSTPSITEVPTTVAEVISDSWAPDRVRDVILSNLLEVRSFPTAIWNGATDKKDSTEVRTEAHDAEAHIIRAKRIWTFANLKRESCQLRKAIDISTVKDPISSRDWIVDPEKIWWWVALLNKALTTHLSKLAIKREDKGRYFFRPKDGQDRIWQNGSDPARAVASKKISPIDGSTFWVHHAARIRFKLIGERFFLMIEPTYLFTTDGTQPLAGQEMGKMVIMWGGKQRNPAILRNFLFWAKTIARNKRFIEIETAGEPIVISAIPALTVASQGIGTDHIRVGSLMKTVDTDLDAAAQDVEIIQPDETDEEVDEAAD